MQKISIIIATHNRYETLANTLKSILPVSENLDAEVELMIVDNNSNDNTRQTVERFKEEFTFPVVYIFEPRQGKSFALNRGIKEAKGDICVFTDDDVIVDKHWLLNIFECFKKHNCDGVAGKVLPNYPENTPDWIKEHAEILNGPIVFRDHGEGTQAFDEKTMLPFIGANVAYRRSLFEKFGYYREDLGPGSSTPFGEDTEFFRRIKDHVNLYYCGKSIVWHLHEKERLNLRYVLEWFRRSGKSSMREAYDSLQKSDIRTIFNIPVFLYRALLKDILSLVVYMFDAKMRLKKLCLVNWQLGKMSEYRRQAKAADISEKKEAVAS